MGLTLWVLIPLVISFLIKPTLSETDNVNVVVVQPNIDPYGEKFGGLTADEQLEKLLTLANEKVDKTTDYLIGPETALTGGLWENNLEQSSLIKRLQNYLQEYPQLKIIVGASTYKLFEEGEVLSETVRYHKGSNRYYDAYNTALQLDTSGVQLYHKSKLVQGVEMMPFAPILKHFKLSLIHI